MQIRILVVDDEKETGDYLQLLLTKAGYEVVALTDPTQVMDRLRAEDFHLVILDMMMPQMSGTELLEKIRGYESAGTLWSPGYFRADLAAPRLDDPERAR